MVFEVLEKFIAALFPVVALLLVAYFMDKYQKEPIKEMLKAFAFGCVSVILTFLLVFILPTSYIVDDNAQFLGSGILNAFFNAAIPEELAKFIMLWLFVRNSKYFDEKTDGLVYAGVIALGFAAIENILYVFGSDFWQSVAITRAIFAVPGHFCDGLLMGYFYSKVKFSNNPSVTDKIMVLLSPILAHGIYDSLLMEAANIPSLVIRGLMFISFIVFVVLFWRHARKKLLEHLKADKEFFDSITTDQSN